MNSDYNRLYNLIINTRSMVTKMDERLTALETTCSPDSSASPAAAPGTSPTSPQPSAGGAGGGPQALGPTASSSGPTASSGSSPVESSGVGSSITSDPTAAIRADPKRPKWLTDEMLPLPVGTKRVWWSSGIVLAYPEKLWFRREEVDWGGYACDEDTAKTIPYAEVYHVPQPAPADKPMILPPAEMPEALRPYWTPESRVYIDWARSVYVYPSQMAMIASCGIPFKAAHSEAKVVDKNCTLLPNRTVTTESILGTASAAKAVEQGVADVLEGRTVEVSKPKCPHPVSSIYTVIEGGVPQWLQCLKCSEVIAGGVAIVNPSDPLDQLAAEAQAEGEDAKPTTPRRTAREVAEGIALAYGLSLEHHAPLVRSIAAAIERDREGAG